MAGVRNIYDLEHVTEAHQINQALKARALYHRDTHYLVRDGEAIIVDEFTGRTMPGRRWSDGLHQAVEAKEGLKVQQEMKTLATITLQNYFRLYGKLAGMTGTAVTEAEEFHKIYGLEVVVIPTNRPMTRELAVKAKVVLERDGGQGLLLLLNLQALFGLDRLVEAIRPAPARHG